VTSDVTALRAALETVFTERLWLSRPSAADLDAVWAIHGDPRAREQNPHEPLTDRASAVAMLDEWIATWGERGVGYWAVRLREDGSIIGFGGIQFQTFHERTVLNLYYRLSPEAWGCGYASELVARAIDTACLHFPDLPIVARIRAANAAARRVAESGGMERREDLDTEHVVYALGWTPP
jgi:ribosomal-protein-alanine N-acetyltransferase